MDVLQNSIPGSDPVPTVVLIGIVYLRGFVQVKSSPPPWPSD